MEAFSMDLRERVIAAYDRGDGSSRQLAGVFGVSSAWIRKLLRRRKQTGSIAALPCRCGRKRKLTERQRDRLIELAAEEPDLTLEELKHRLRLRVSVSTVSVELIKAGFTRKKRASSSPSRGAKRSGVVASVGAAA